jgi:hypothetical protein
MTTEEQFHFILRKLDGLAEPTTTSELVIYMSAVSEALELCEKLVLYLATSPSRSEDLLTTLFQYKQLLNLERRMSGLRYNLPAGKPEAKEEKPPKRRWWKWRG